MKISRVSFPLEKGP